MNRLVTAEWGAREYGAMMRTLTSSARNRGDALDELEAKLGEFFPGTPLLLVNRARHGLALALEALAERRPGRSEVIVPSYVCASVVGAIETCGLTPVPVEVGADLNIDLAAVSRALSDRTLAVIAVHMYGCPCPVA